MNMNLPRSSILVLAANAGFFAIVSASAQVPFSLTSFTPSEREAYLAAEKTLLESPNTDRLRETHTTLAQETHVAGTPADARTVERVATMFREAGLEVQIHDIWPLLSTPISASVAVVTPEYLKLDLTERPLKEDPYSAVNNLTWNAYSASGQVTAPVVYANYGTKADFAALAARGVDCKGKVILARYGGNYRGYKVKFAQEAGAAALLIFTDPADSGYTKGLTYPEGSFSNDCCVQRGSILTLPYQGDPLTPGVEAVEKAPRQDESTVALPKIPVQPISYAAAKEILSRMTGPGVPDGWQGGLPFAYRLTGGDALQVRVEVEQKREIKRTANVIATLPGSEFPDELVILGAHHDAWNHGAADPLCGTITVIEAARGFAALAKQGVRPKRTLVFAAWAAEEFGIIGSTEWVEANRDKLSGHAVAYINLDMASMGTDFGASATPSLRAVIADAAGVVPQPGVDNSSVLASWSSKSPDPRMPGFPAMGDIGGGSDHVAFLCFAGVPSAGFGSGGSKGNSYHSSYDTLIWYWKTVGGDYQSAQLVTRMAAATASRLANAPIAPLDPGAYGAVAAAKISQLSPEDAFAATAQGEAVRAAWSAWWFRVNQDASALTHDARAKATQSLLAADRLWMDERGLPDRPWYKNTFSSPDEDSGYAAWTLPKLCRAAERGDPKAKQEAVADILERLSRLAELPK
ncbi:MAG: M28 family peptidase [Planctomycetes bacterium]|nr:M28 family peptidase [Planctomycetota bacterium]